MSARAKQDPIVVLAPETETLICNGPKRFFVSDNGVILCPGDAQGYIAPRFFAKAVRARTGELLLHGISPSAEPT